MAFDYLAPIFIVMNFVTIESQGREAKECDGCLNVIAIIFRILEDDFCWFGRMCQWFCDFGTKYPISTMQQLVSIRALRLLDL